MALSCNTQTHTSHVQRQRFTTDRGLHKSDQNSLLFGKRQRGLTEAMFDRIGGVRTLTRGQRKKLGARCVVVGCFHVYEAPDRQGGSHLCVETQ